MELRKYQFAESAWEAGLEHFKSGTSSHKKSEVFHELKIAEIREPPSYCILKHIELRVKKRGGIRVFDMQLNRLFLLFRRVGKWVLALA